MPKGLPKPNKFYKYKEVTQPDGTIAFGWTEDSKIEDEEYVISYPSRSKLVSEEDVEWSNLEGVSAAGLSDYSIYFIRITGKNSSDFFGEWNEKLDDLEESRKLSNRGYRDGEGLFLLNLSQLISGRTKMFSQFGRVYKRVKDF